MHCPTERSIRRLCRASYCARNTSDDKVCYRPPGIFSARWTEARSREHSDECDPPFPWLPVVSGACSQRPVVVYGANGFIGRNLLLTLCELGIETTAVSRSFNEMFTDRLSNAIHFVKSDFCDTDRLVDTVVPPGGATHVMLVSDSVPSTWSKKPSREVSGNLLSHVRFFERLRPVDRVIFLSSGGTVYGAPNVRRPLRESDAGLPISAYGVTKLAIEEYLAFLARGAGFSHVILRPSNPVGPWVKSDASQGFVGVLLQNYLAGRPTRIWGDGTATRDYHDVRDLVNAVVAVCLNESLDRETFNVGSGIGRTLNSVVELVRETLVIDPVVLFEQERDVDAPYNVLNCSHIFETLGWKPQYDFRTTIADTWRFMKEGGSKLVKNRQPG